MGQDLELVACGKRRQKDGGVASPQPFGSELVHLGSESSYKVVGDGWVDSLYAIVVARRAVWERIVYCWQPREGKYHHDIGTPSGR